MRYKYYIYASFKEESVSSSLTSVKLNSVSVYNQICIVVIPFHGHPGRLVVIYAYSNDYASSA